MKKSKVSIGLLNPKSPENVSSVMRSAGNFTVDSVYYTGPRYQRALERNPSTPNMSRDVSQGIPLSEVDSLVDILSSDTKIVCVELAENATPLPEFQHPDNALYIFGPEDSSITQDIIDRADAVVYVPTTGCMNLAATVNVLLYDRMAKSFSSSTSVTEDNNICIRKNRDINNHLKFSG